MRQPNASPIPDFDEHLILEIIRPDLDEDDGWTWSIDKIVPCGRGHIAIEVRYEGGYPDADAAIKAGLAVKNALEDAANPPTGPAPATEWPESSGNSVMCPKCGLTLPAGWPHTCFQIQGLSPASPSTT